MSHFSTWFFWSLGLGAFSVWAAGRLAQHLGWLDHPNERSFHTNPTPRIGGIGILVPVLAGLVLLLSLRDIQDTAQPTLLLAPAFLIAILSYLDDRVGLPRMVRFSGHIICGVVVLYLFREAWRGQPLPFTGTALTEYLTALLLLVWIVGLTNAFNFMDGIDGLAAVQALVATLGWLSVFLMESPLDPGPTRAQALILVSLSGGIFAFLLLNWSPASIFMGDVGSTFLGFYFASLPLGFRVTGLPFEKCLEAGVFFTWPFIADAGGTFIWRLFTRQRVFEAHRTHLYQVLAASFPDRENGHRFTALLFGLLGIFGVGIYWTPGPLWAKLILPALLWLALAFWAYGIRAKQNPSTAVSLRKGDNAEKSRKSPDGESARYEIYLSPPELTEIEWRRVKEAFGSGFIAPVGPQVEAFERELCRYLDIPDIQAVNSGTAAIHLGLRALGAGPGDCVLCPDLTFIASVNPVRYLGAEPVLVDVDPGNWAMDVELARKAIRSLKREGRTVRALVIVHAFGIPAPMEAVMNMAREEGVKVLEDCAGAFGSRIGERSVGSFGDAAAFSFNGNKVLTTSGGGAVYIRDPELRKEVRSWANQGKEPGIIGYSHSTLGYNYRLSNISAAIGLGQLETLQDRLSGKRDIFNEYRRRLNGIDGVTPMPEPEYGNNNYWLSCFGTRSGGPGRIVSALHDRRIEAAPMWKPMHMQWLNRDLRCFGGEVGEEIYRTHFSLPSGSALAPAQVERICRLVRDQFTADED